MVLLYNLGIRLYILLIRMVAPFKAKAGLWLDGRKGWRQRVEAAIPRNTATAWVHCSSLGEFEQGRPLIEAIKSRFPHLKIVLTFFSPSGYEVRKNYPGADYIFYLPMDTRKNAKDFVALVNPQLAVFVKYEFWYHYLKTLKQRNTPTYVVSAIFRDNQAFFGWYGGWYRRFLLNFDYLFVQNRHSQELLSRVGIDNVQVTGDTRFDRVAKVASEAKAIPLVEQFCNGERVVVAGSTWPKDEELLAEYIAQHPGQAKLIIVPHEVDAPHIRAILQSLPVETALYSNGQSASLQSARALVVDTVGLLSSIYRYGHIAYIGGGFGVGIHNTLEAAAFGIPVIFGLNYHKFQEAEDLVAAKAAFSIKSAKELSNSLNSLLADEKKRAQAGNAAKKLVLLGAGATNRILDRIAADAHQR